MSGRREGRRGGGGGRDDKDLSRESNSVLGVEDRVFGSHGEATSNVLLLHHIRCEVEEEVKEGEGGTERVIFEGGDGLRDSFVEKAEDVGFGHFHSVTTSPESCEEVILACLPYYC